MGDIFGGDKKETTTSTTVVDLPSWVRRPMQNMVRRAEDLSNNPFTAYTDPRFAQFTNDEMAAFDLTRDLIAQSGYDITPSKDISAEVARRGLEGFSSSELSPFMNPYIENVLDINRRRQFENFDRNINQYRQRASQAGAFGGSRFGLGEAQMLDDFQQQMADFDQQGLYDSFNQGYGRAMQGTQMAGQTAMDMANLEGAEQQGTLADAQALLGIGGMQRGLNQQGLDFDYEQFMREQAFPYEQVQFASGIINPAAQINKGSTRTSVKETEGGSGWLGTAIGLGSMALGIPGVGAALGAGLGGGSMMAGLASGGTGLSGLAKGYLGSSIAGNMTGPGTVAGGGIFGKHLNKGGLVTASPKGYNQGGVVTANGYNEGGLINAIKEYATRGPEEKPNPESAVTLFDLQELWANDKFGNSSGDAMAPKPDNKPRPKKRQNSGAISPTYYDALSFIESSNNPKAVNEYSGAAGPFQFLPSTAKAYNLEDPTDYQQALEAAQRFTEDNRKVLKKNLKREPTLPELYLAHQQGATGSSKLLMNPNEKAYKVVGAKEVKRNLPSKLRDNYKNITAKEFANLWLSKFENEYQRLTSNNGYNQGGLTALSPFRRDLQSRVINPLLGVKDSLVDSILGTTQSIGRGLDYFTTGTEHSSKVDQLVENTRLKQAEEKLLRGEAPTNLRRMMSQVNPLVNAGATQVSLDPLGNRLMVDAYTPREQASTIPQNPGQQLMEAVTKVVPPKPQRKPEQKGKEEDTTETTQMTQPRTQESGMNLPLIAFGAQLLASRNGFKRALGEAALAGVSTKAEVDANASRALREQAEMELKRRNADLQSLRVGAELERLNRTNPYEGILQELELQKKLQDLSGQDNLQKAIDDMAKTLMETNPIYSQDPDKAYQDASRVVMSYRVGSNLSNNGTQQIAPAQPVAVEDWLKKQ